MAAGKKNPDESKTGTPGSTRSLRDDAEEQLAHSPKRSSGMEGQTPEQLIHELEVHQVELETQAEELRRAYIALGESRDKYLDLYEFAPTGYLTLNDKALITDVNLTGAMLLGVERRDLLKAPFSKFFAQKDADPWHLNFVNVLKNGEHLTCNPTLIRGDGSTFPARLEGVKLISSSDEAVMVRIAFGDITDIRNAKEALKRSEEEYRRLVEKSYDGIWLSDKESLTVYANPAMEEMLGYSKEEMVGRNWYDFGDPEWVLRAKEHGKLRESGIEMPHEFLFIHKDGRKVMARISTTPLFDNEGHFDGALGILSDITERKRVEDALRQLSDRLSLATRAGGVGIWDYDVVTNTLTWDDLMFALYGISREQFSGAYDAWQACIHPDDRARCDAEIRMALRGEREFDTEFRVLWPDGSIRNIRALAIVQRDAEGTPLRMIGTNWDITAQKKAEEALSQANRKLNLLSSITRHDINNQLTVQMGYLDILGESKFDHSQENYFQKVSTAAKRISAMVKFTKEYEEIGVNAPVWQDCRILVDTAAKQATFGHVMVENDLPAGAEVFADPLIVKVFYNLMDNAVRYGGKITTIRFSVEVSEDVHLVVCEDDGNGVPVEEKEKIFELGFGKNTGLGLALSREILDITGITIRETGAPGKGTRFEMAVPKDAWRMPGKSE